MATGLAANQGQTANKMKPPIFTTLIPTFENRQGRVPKMMQTIKKTENAK